MPLLSRGGVAATSIKYREASFYGAAGVVLVSKIILFDQHHFLRLALIFTKKELLLVIPA